MSRSYAPRSLRSLRMWKNYLSGKDAVGLGPLLFCWRHGFYPDRALTYDFKTHGPERYLPDGVERPKDAADRAYAARCGDKVNFFLQMRAIGAPTPEVVAENVGGRLIFYSQPGDYEALLAERGELVIKPRDGAHGSGVRIVRPGDPDRALKPNEFASARVSQHPYAAAINPHSVNTIRVLTAWDEPSRDFFVIAAGHRFGTARSGRVDNVSAGGLAAGICVESGRLAAAIRPDAPRVELTRMTHHPDTGARIEGVETPGFARMCEELLAVCRRFPLIFVGWDIVITADGWTALEANRGPSLNAFQLNGPLLLDPRAKAFFRREGMV
jgi:Sugar-transfer associated ATP-grasp